MKMRKMAAFLTVAALAATVLTGCSTVKKYAVTDTGESGATLSVTVDSTTTLVPDVTSIPEPTETPTPTATPTPTETPTPTPTPELPKVIGTEAEGDSIITIELTNNTGKDITEFNVKDTDTADYTDNMLADTWSNGETRTLYFDTANYANGTKWTVRCAYSDGGVNAITNYPFTEMTAGTLEISSEDGLLYVSFTSASTGEDTDTLETERSYRNPAHQEGYTGTDDGE